jgi:hypothetical protein
MLQNEVIELGKTKGVEVIFLKYGTACRMGDKVLINEAYLKEPKLLAKVLDHEFRHSSGPYTKKDVEMDLLEGDLFETIWFNIKHPSSLTQYLPIGWYNKEFFYDPVLLIEYGIVIGLVTFIWMILNAL